MKPTPGKNAKCQAHEIVGDEGVGRLSRHWLEEVDLHHGDGSREADKHRGAEAGGFAMLRSVIADQDSGKDREHQTQGNVLPRYVQGHSGNDCLPEEPKTS